MKDYTADEALKFVIKLIVRIVILKIAVMIIKFAFSVTVSLLSLAFPLLLVYLIAKRIKSSKDDGDVRQD